MDDKSEYPEFGQIQDFDSAKPTGGDLTETQRWKEWQQSHTFSAQRARLPRISVSYEGKQFDLRLAATGAKDKKAGLNPGDSWDGYLTLALYTQPDNPQQIKDVLEALARQGFDGLIVGRVPSADDTGAMPIRFSEFNLVYALSGADYEAYGYDLIAKVEVTYTSQRDRFVAQVIKTDSGLQIVRGTGES